MWCGAISCSITVFLPFTHLTVEGGNTSSWHTKHATRAWCGTTSGMTGNLQYLSTVDMDHKRCKNGPETPQNYIVHPMLVPVVSYLISYPAFKCLQYHPRLQTCVCTVIGTQKLTYEQYGNGPQTVQNRAKYTSYVHRSSHSHAHSIIFYVVLIIQMHAIPTQAPNMCVYSDRHAKAYL